MQPISKVFVRYNVKIYHGGDTEFVLSHFSPSFATDHFYHAGLFTKASSVSLISIKFIKRLDQPADDSFPGSLKCEARNRREGKAADARPVFERIFAFPLCFESSIKLGEKNFCIFENNSENPLAVGKFGIGVQIQIACSTMSDLNLSLCVRCHDPRYICFISESSKPVAPLLPCEAAAVPLWPDLDWVFVVFGETGRWSRRPSYVTDLNLRQKQTKIQNMIKQHYIPILGQ